MKKYDLLARSLRRPRQSGIRYLFNHLSHETPEIAILNNSGLFMTHASIIHHDQPLHSDLKVIAPPFWIDSTQPHCDQLDWGQTKYGLPWFVRELFEESFPDHPESEFIKWHQFKKLRAFLKEDLKRLGVSVYSGTPTITKMEEKEGFKIKLNDVSLEVPKNTFFYNSYRIPQLSHPYGDQLPKVPHTKLYQLPPDERPDSIIVIGDGLSVYWLSKHFPDTPIACIAKNDPRIWFDKKGEGRPQNLRVYLVDSEKLTLFPSTPDGFAILLSDDKNKPPFEGYFCCALGLKQNTELTSCVPSSQLLLYPKENKYGMTFDQSSWTASEDIPIGSLKEAVLRWADATNNLPWSSSYFCFHDGYYLTDLAIEMRKSNLLVDEEFFKILREAIRKEIYTSSEKTRVHKIAPNIQTIIEIYQEAYQARLGRKLSEEEVIGIRTVFDSYERSRKDNFHQRWQERRSFVNKM